MYPHSSSPVTWYNLSKMESTQHKLVRDAIECLVYGERDALLASSSNECLVYGDRDILLLSGSNDQQLIVVCPFEGNLFLPYPLYPLASL